MKKYFLFLISLPAFLHAQDAFLTQYNSAPLYLNPGFAGSTGQARAASSFRDQWPGLSGNFITTNVSYDQYFACLQSGIGINLQNDLAGQGSIRTNSAALVYAFHLPLFNNKLVIQPGISFGLLHKHVNWDQLNFGDMVDPRRGFVFNTSEQPTKTTINRFDISTGFVAYTNRITVGFSAAHLDRPDVGFFGTVHLPIRYTINASGVIGHLPGDFENRFSLIPQLVFTQQGNEQMFLGGISALFKNYTVGIAYRNDDAVIFMAGFQNHLFRACYSYDYTVSSLDNSATGGSHELSVQFFLFGKKKPSDFLSPAATVF